MKRARDYLSAGWALMALAAGAALPHGHLPASVPAAAGPAVAAPAPAAALDGDLVVRFRRDCRRARRDQLVATLGCRTERFDPGSGWALVPARGGHAGDLLAVLGRRAEVARAEPSYRLHVCALPSLYDPYEWYLFPRGMRSARAVSEFGIQAAPAWSYTRGAGVTVAILDTGVAFENRTPFYQAPGLANTHFVSGYDFVNGSDHPDDDNGHGTFVAGIVAGTLVDGGGVIGAASEATLMPIKAMGADGSGIDYVVAQSIRWAADHGAQVINLSVAAPKAGSILGDACQYAANKDCVLVAASGDEGAADVDYPAHYTPVIAVGAIGFDGARASYSNAGRNLEVVAPGGILSQHLNVDGEPDGIVAQTFDPSQGYNSFDFHYGQGTSYSAPLISSVAALIRSANPSLSALDVRSILRDTAYHLGSTPGRSNDYGYGLADALAAVQAALAQK